MLGEQVLRLEFHVFGCRARVGVAHQPLEGDRVHALAEGLPGEGRPQDMRPDPDPAAAYQAGESGS